MELDELSMHVPGRFNGVQNDDFSHLRGELSSKSWARGAGQTNQGCESPAIEGVRITERLRAANGLTH